jgi:hypothetical protein
MKKKILLLSLLSLICCNQKEKIKIVQSENKIPSHLQKNLVLETFTEFPEEVDGAGCYFSANKKNFKKGKYIYVSDLDSICFIKVKGRLVKLQLAERAVDTTYQHYKEKFKDAEFELSIDYKKTGDGDDEEGIFEGAMSIKQNNKPEEKTNLYGDCGC